MNNRDIFGTISKKPIYSINSMKDGEYNLKVEGVMVSGKYGYIFFEKYCIYTVNDFLVDRAIICSFDRDFLKFEITPDKDPRYKSVKL